MFNKTLRRFALAGVALGAAGFATLGTASTAEAHGGFGYGGFYGPRVGVGLYAPRPVVVARPVVGVGYGRSFYGGPGLYRAGYGRGCGYGGFGGYYGRGGGISIGW